MVASVVISTFMHACIHVLMYVRIVCAYVYHSYHIMHMHTFQFGLRQLISKNNISIIR